MSDHDDAPDPIDQAYVQAEAMLNDEAARATRRARLLAAVAREPVARPEAAVAAAAPAPVSAEPTQLARARRALRHGPWLATAGVVGLSLLVAVRIAPVNRLQPPPAPKPAAPTLTSGRTAPSPAPLVGVAPPRPEPVRQALAGATPTPQPARPDIQPAAPPPAPAIAPSPQAFPATPAPAPPPSSAPSDIVVTGERAALASRPAVPGRRLGGAVEDALVAPGAAPGTDQPRSFTAMPSVPGPPAAFARSARARDDPAAHLRAAAAAGRINELEALLAQGVPVDAPDAEGNTALMRGVQADQPAAAALLRRHGASIDLRNHAGDSARDLAAAYGDPALDKAIGLGP